MAYKKKTREEHKAEHKAATELTNKQARMHGQTYHTAQGEVSRSEFRTITGGGGDITPNVEAYNKSQEELKRKKELEVTQGYAQRNIDVKEAERRILEERKQEEIIPPQAQQGNYLSETQLAQGKEEKAPFLQRVIDASPFKDPNLQLSNVLGVDPNSALGQVNAATLGVMGAAATPKAIPIINIKATPETQSTTNRLAKAFNKKPEVIEKMINNANLKIEIGKLAKGGTLLKDVGKMAFKFGATIAGADAFIATWYALDNIISGTSIFLRDTVSDVQWGTESYDNAVLIFDKAQKDIDFASEFVTTSARFNPFLFWPLGKFYKRGLIAQQNMIDGQRQRLENVK